MINLKECLWGISTVRCESAGCSCRSIPAVSQVDRLSEFYHVKGWDQLQIGDGIAWFYWFNAFSSLDLIHSVVSTR